MVYRLHLVSLRRTESPAEPTRNLSSSPRRSWSPRRRPGRWLGLGSVGLFAVSAALAAETDNAPAATCVPTNGSTITLLPGGEIENASTQSVTVICPANRKVINGVYTAQFSGVVFGRDNNASTNLCCKAVSASPSTTINGTEICTNGVTPPTNFAQLALPQVIDTSTSSHFFIQCTIPGRNASNSARSQLYSFRSTQQ